VTIILHGQNQQRHRDHVLGFLLAWRYDQLRLIPLLSLLFLSLFSHTSIQVREYTQRASNHETQYHQKWYHPVVIKNGSLQFRKKVPCMVVMRTSPELWEKAKKLALAKYSKDKRWDARVAQQSVRLYKSMGGGYVGPKPKNNSLTRWTEEKWMHHPSDKKKTGRYLPEKVWKQLTPRQVRKTIETKRDGTKKYVNWEPFVGNAFRKMRAGL